MQAALPLLTSLAKAIVLNQGQKEGLGILAKQTHASTSPLWKTLEQSLGCDLLQVELHRLRLAPPAPPGHKGQVFSLQVKECSA